MVMLLIGTGLVVAAFVALLWLIFVVLRWWASLLPYADEPQDWDEWESSFVASCRCCYTTGRMGAELCHCCGGTGWIRR